MLAKLWPWVLVAGSVLLVIGLVIAITGSVPGVIDPEQIISIDWAILGGGWVLFLLAFAAGFAHDIEEKAWT